MRAIVIHEKGPAENLHVVELPDPQPAESEVVVGVSYSGINHGDLIRRERGIFPAEASPPYVLGLEGAGTVTAVGAKVRGIGVGQRVAFLTESGGYAQMISVPANQVAAIPDEVSESVAAAAFCVGLTAWHLVRIASLKPGENVLVHGGAGGVGAVLIQMCRLRAARVLATVGSREKAAFAESVGSDVVINHRDLDFSQRVLDETDGRGVAAVFDCVGRAVVDGNFRCLARGGRILYYGSSSGHAQFPGDRILNGEAQVRGFVIFGMFAKRALWQQGVEGLLGLLRDRRLEVSLRELPMTDVVLAHKMLEDREVIGKLILNMR